MVITNENVKKLLFRIDEEIDTLNYLKDDTILKDNLTEYTKGYLTAIDIRLAFL